MEALVSCFVLLILLTIILESSRILAHQEYRHHYEQERNQLDEEL